ncbi:hypothetical protein OSTOST_04131 [Ostertagia ostertagi]
MLLPSHLSLPPSPSYTSLFFEHIVYIAYVTERVPVGIAREERRKISMRWQRNAAQQHEGDGSRKLRIRHHGEFFRPAEAVDPSVERYIMDREVVKECMKNVIKDLNGNLSHTVRVPFFAMPSAYAHYNPFI